MSESSALVLESLGHAFGSNRVFSDVSLEIGPGEVVAILGASGSGKSTLLRSAAGFVTPTSGRILIGGSTVVADGRELVPAEQRGVGLMFQDYALFPHMNVRENVAFGIPGQPDAPHRVDELLGLVGLGGLGDRRPGSLSGGQQQRVALARALAPRPSTLLLDEPFANLDGPLRQEVSEQVCDVLRRQGIGALLVTHDRAQALGLADRVAVLASTSTGSPSILQLGSPQEIYEGPRTREVAKLTGRAGFIPGDTDGALGRTSLGEVPLCRVARGRVTLAVRPEQVTFAEEAGGSAKVIHRRYCGRIWELELETPEGRLLVDHAGPRVPEVGASGVIRLLGACPLDD
ncbi:MAG: ABC transporter ATP-binding protein [Myxococcota bacterium]|nr:ABC transporter ATP-binding protein [Myxococcota bacterium]